MNGKVQALSPRGGKRYEENTCTICSDPAATISLHFASQTTPCPHRFCVKHLKVILSCAPISANLSLVEITCPVCSMMDEFLSLGNHDAVGGGESHHSVSQMITEKRNSVHRELVDLQKAVELQEYAKQGLEEELARTEESLRALREQKSMVNLVSTCLDVAAECVLKHTCSEKTAALKPISEGDVGSRMLALEWTLDQPPSILPHAEQISILGSFKNWCEQNDDELERVAGNESFVQSLFEVCGRQIVSALPPIKVALLGMLRVVLRHEQIAKAFVRVVGGAQAIVELLKSINDNVKSEAAALLAVLIRVDPAAISDALVRPLSVNLLSPSNHVRDACVQAISAVSCVGDDARQLLLDVGVVDKLLDLIDGSERNVHDVDGDVNRKDINSIESVLIAVGYLSRSDKIKSSLGSTNGLSRIRSLLASNSTGVLAKACGALWNCASNAENRRKLKECGAIDDFVRILRTCDDELVRENAAGALWNCAVDPENKVYIADVGGISVLMHLLDLPGIASQTAVVENVSGTLWNCTAVKGNRDTLCDACNFFVSVVKLLLERLPEKALTNLLGCIRNCLIDEVRRQEAVRSGLVNVVVNISRSGPSVEVLDKCCSVMWLLSVSEETRAEICSQAVLSFLLDVLRMCKGSLLEKVLGCLRNMLSVGAFRQMFLSSDGVQSVATVMNTCSTLSDAARDHLVGVLLWVVKDGAGRMQCASSPFIVPAAVELCISEIQHFSSSEQVLLFLLQALSVKDACLKFLTVDVHRFFKACFESIPVRSPSFFYALCILKSALSTDDCKPLQSVLQCFRYALDSVLHDPSGLDPSTVKCALSILEKYAQEPVARNQLSEVAAALQCLSSLDFGDSQFTTLTGSQATHSIRKSIQRLLESMEPI